MEFPREIMIEIMKYIPHPCRKPPHVAAINKDCQFANFVIDQALYHEDGETPEWNNSFIAYKKWRCDLRN